MFYSIPAIVGLIVLIVSNFDILFYRHYRAYNVRAYQAYRLLCLSLAAFYVTDIVYGYVEPLTNKTAAFVDASFFFVTMALTLLAWTNFVTRYVEDNKLFKKIIAIAGYVFAVPVIICVVINIFTPVLFTFNGDSYVPQVARYLIFGFQVTMNILTSIYALITMLQNKGFKKGQMRTLAMFGLIMASAITFQMYFPIYPIYSAGLAVGMIIVHTFLVTVEKKGVEKALLESREREEKTSRVADNAKRLAYIDPLTGVKNKHAFVELEQRVDRLIHDGHMEQFALVIFDLNDLKNINDTYGHDMGDEYIVKSCQIIRDHFPGVEIYRYGGDEFVIVLTGQLFEERFARLERFDNLMESNIDNNEPVVSAGLSDFVKEKDNTLRSVFNRADERMYSRKRRLKDMKNNTVDDLGNRVKGASAIDIRFEMYEMFYHNRDVSLVDMLNSSNCDEVVDFDIKNDTFKQIYHVDGKYFIPTIDISYRELLKFTYEHIVHPDDRGIYEGLMKIDGFFERLKNARIPNFDFAHFRYKLQGGGWRYVEQVVIAGEEFGIPDGMFRMYVFDIENMKSRQLGKLSVDDSHVISVGRDPLTGLLTGKEFFKKADLFSHKDPNKQCCLVAIDIEHFRFFDEWFGREKGDALLVKIGVELKEFAEKYGGVAGYFGGDDFSLVMEYDMGRITDLFTAIHHHINSFGMATGFLPAFGIAQIENNIIITDAFDRATIAALSAKKDLKNRICTYSYEMQFLAEKEYRVLTDFVRALQNDEIVFYAQPQIELATGKIVGAEALARWLKPDGKIIPPNDFIPVLEKYGFVTELDKRIWEKVCEWIKNWTQAGNKVVPISVNVSQIDIFNIDIAEHFSELCDRYDIPHKSIKIEITESAYAESMAKVDELVKVLRKKGFVVLMDDFGSGYSSLNMLSTLKLDAIKLDNQFLNMERKGQENGIHVIESVVNMAKTMGLPVIVEGVEKKEQCSFLLELGVQYVQGYYFYKPLPISQFESTIGDAKKLSDKGFRAKLNEQFRIREFMDETIYSDSMLNNILGAVALYSWNKEHVDIVRFNQQFFEAVNVPDFNDRLVNIEQFVPEGDRHFLFEALKEAKENRLTGANGLFPFYRTDGSLSFFKIHFYYIGKKEGTERFYGSAVNVTELVGLQEAKSLVAKYSQDNLIFINKVNGKWHYMVISHVLSDVIGLKPLELEEELNNGKFMERVVNKKDLKTLMKEANELKNPDENTEFTRRFEIVTNSKAKVTLEISVKYVGNENNNIDYILRSHKVDD